LLYTQFIRSTTLLTAALSFLIVGPLVAQDAAPTAGVTTAAARLHPSVASPRIDPSV